SAQDESGLPFLARLRAMLQPDAEVAAPTLVSLAQLLNVLGLFAVAARSLARRASASDDPLFVYEVARSVYGLEPDADKAVRPFHLLAAGTGHPPRVRLSAYARLIAHYCRRAKDLTACAEAAEGVQRLIEDVRDDTFEIQMGISRNYRALGLYALR